MVWTHEYPAIPGYYWVRYIGDNDTRSVCCISSWDAIRERQVMYLGHFVSFEFLEFCWVPCPSEQGGSKCTRINSDGS